MFVDVRGAPAIDLLHCSPDGEHRGRLARVGDLFPLDPTGHLLTGSFAEPSEVRPWGLRFARPARPRAGAHEGGTNETTGTTDGDKPGEE